jgi:spermidine/putrescine transport system permease protein
LAYIPLMILPLFASLERLGVELREASADLFSSPFETFRTVTLPLTLPGIVAGCIFVFVPSVGNFIIPDLLGGGRKVMIGNLIQQQFLQARLAFRSGSGDRGGSADAASTRDPGAGIEA